MPGDTLISTRSGALTLARTANSTTAGTSIANPADKLVAPLETDTGLVVIGHDGVMASNGLQLIPFGVGSDANTFLMSVFSWDRLPGDQASKSDQWTAWLLCSFTCTLSSSLTGVANGTIPATSFYCKSITLNAGNANVSVEVVSPGTEKATVTLDAKGGRFLEVLFAMNASATSANALYRRI